MQRMLIMTCTDGTLRVRDLVSSGQKIRHPRSGATNVVSAGVTVVIAGVNAVIAGVNAVSAGVSAVRLRLVAVGVAIAIAPVALAGAAVTEKVVGRKETAETSVGSEAGPPLPGIPGGACLLIGGGTIGPGLPLWMMA